MKIVAAIRHFKDIFQTTCSNRKGILLLTCSLLLVALGIIANLLVPISFKNIIEFLEGHQKDMSIFVLIAYGIVWMVSRAISYAKEIFTHEIKEKYTTKFVLKVIAHIYSLPIEYFIDNQIGGFLNIIKRVQHNLSIMISGILFFILPMVLEIIITTAGLYVYYPAKYMLILLIMVLFFIVYNTLFIGFLVKKRIKANALDKKSDCSLTEYIMQYELIKSFGIVKCIISKCKKALLKREQQKINYLKVSDLLHVGQVLIWGIGLVVLTYTMGSAVLLGELTVGDFVLFHGYFIQFISPIGSLSYVLHNLKKSFADFQDAIDMLNIQPSIKQKKKAVSLKKSQSYSIEFRNVSFGYKDRLILDNVSFKVESGERVGIIGSSGEGKTTILKLILRLYDANEGEILINGHNIKSISLNSLYQNIGILHQETHLFNDTVKNNLLLGNSKASIRDIEKAGRMLNIADFVSDLPDRYDTMVGEQGRNFSGGEKQRISLARLLLKKPSIALFDEPTSSLDRKNAQEIESRIYTLFKDSTVIIISHKYSTIQKLDRVFVLENMKIKHMLPFKNNSNRENTHRELINKNNSLLV